MIDFILACLTNGGEDPNAHCILEWTYPVNGLTYKGCANPDVDPGGDWCPTEVNEDGQFEPKSGKWGYCSENCRRDHEGIMYISNRFTSKI